MQPKDNVIKDSLLKDGKAKRERIVFGDPLATPFGYPIVHDTGFLIFDQPENVKNPNTKLYTDILPRLNKYCGNIRRVSIPDSAMTTSDLTMLQNFHFRDTVQVTPGDTLTVGVVPIIVTKDTKEEDYDIQGIEPLDTYADWFDWIWDPIRNIPRTTIMVLNKLRANFYLMSPDFETIYLHLMLEGLMIQNKPRTADGWDPARADVPTVDITLSIDVCYVKAMSVKAESYLPNDHKNLIDSFVKLS